MSIFVILGLQLVCTQVQGAMTGILYVRTGEDLILPLKELIVLGDGDDFTWKVRGSGTIGKLSDENKTTIYLRYTRRAEFSAQNQSLLLKSVQKTDSGVYTAQISGDKDQTVAKYNVTVLDPVSPVKLRVISTSSDSCNVTVSCSTLDSHISSTFTCDTNTCSQEGGERSKVTTSGASHSVYLSNNSITCNHSNQVSWTKDVTKIQDFCPCHAGSQCVSAGDSVCLVKTVVFSVGLIVMLSAVTTVHVVERLKKQK